mmetsp:Transcript_27842/g.66300  ORF Transcript_27842/g.66300 Transcript_27842/m.66300 type:complete len:413 (+) Transcript_27842:1170-2408(+)
MPPPAVLGAERQPVLVPGAVDVVHPDHEVGRPAEALQRARVARHVPQLPAHHPGIRVVPVVITHRAPGARVLDLHAAAPVGTACCQPNLVASAAHADVLAVGAVVVPPAVAPARGEERLVAVAVHVVQPDGARAAAVAVELARALHLLAERAARDASVRVRERIITHRAPLVVVQDLEAEAAIRPARGCPQLKRPQVRPHRNPPRHHRDIQRVLRIPEAPEREDVSVVVHHRPIAPRDMEPPGVDSDRGARPRGGGGERAILTPAPVVLVGVEVHGAVGAPVHVQERLAAVVHPVDAEGRRAGHEPPAAEVVVVRVAPVHADDVGVLLLPNAVEAGERVAVPEGVFDAALPHELKALRHHQDPPIHLVHVIHRRKVDDLILPPLSAEERVHDDRAAAARLQMEELVLPVVVG